MGNGYNSLSAKGTLTKINSLSFRVSFVTSFVTNVSVQLSKLISGRNSSPSFADDDPNNSSKTGTSIPPKGDARRWKSEPEEEEAAEVKEVDDGEGLPLEASAEEGTKVVPDVAAEV